MIYFVRKQMHHNVVLLWTFSATNLLVLWRCSCSRSVKVCVESVSYIFCSFWGSTEWPTADICCGMTGSMKLWSFLNRKIMCCSFKTSAGVMHWTDTPHCSFRLPFMLLCYSRHFAVRITTAHATHLLACGILELKTRFFTWQILSQERLQ